jgi:hypothetical protein
MAFALMSPFEAVRDESALPSRTIRMLEPADFEQRIGLLEAAR